MTSVVPLRSMRNEAGEWLARLQSEYATDEDRRQFEAWAAADPARRETYAQLAATWRRLESLSDINDLSLEAAKGGARRRRWPAPAAAASVAAVIAVISVWALNARPEAYNTAIGEQRRIALPDASTVELNTDSRLAVDFRQTERLVRLDRGEARFKVAQQPQRPFIVKAAGYLIRAVGTEFNVRIDGERVEVLVVEGAVSFLAPSGAGGPVLVRAGQATGSLRPGESIPLEPDELERKLAWSEGMVSFQGETLSEVLAELGRYNRVRFVLADETAAAIRVSGYFRATDVPTFLVRLEENFPVEVHRGTAETMIASRAVPPAPAQ